MVSFPLTLSLSNTAGTKYANVGPHRKQRKKKKKIFALVARQRRETLKRDAFRHTETKGERRHNWKLINNGTHGRGTIGRSSEASAVPTQHAKDKRAENKAPRVTAVRQEKSEVGARFDQRRVMF